MKKKSWMPGLLLIILTLMTIIVRIYYVNHLMVEVSISESIYNAAKVNLGVNSLSSVFSDGFSMQSLYIYNLYLIFMVFGNFTVAGVYLNVLYQVVTVLAVYAIVRNISDKYVALAAGFIVALVPPYIESLAKVTVLNMEIFIAAIAGVVVSFIARLIYNRYTAKKKTVQSQIPTVENVVTVVQPEIDAAPDTSLREIVLEDLEENKEQSAEKAVIVQIDSLEGTEEKMQRTEENLITEQTSSSENTEEKDIPKEAEEEKVHYIENPLPVPKRREHKEMNFALELTQSDDDYDLKDMTGMDYFDIE